MLAQRRRLRAVCIICRCKLTPENVVPFRLGGRVIFATCVEHRETALTALLGVKQLAGEAAKAFIEAQLPGLVRDAKKLGKVLSGLLGAG